MKLIVYPPTFRIKGTGKKIQGRESERDVHS